MKITLSVSVGPKRGEIVEIICGHLNLMLSPAFPPRYPSPTPVSFLALTLLFPPFTVLTFLWVAGDSGTLAVLRRLVVAYDF